MTNSMNDTNTPNDNPSEPFVLPSLDELVRLTNEKNSSNPVFEERILHSLTNEEKEKIQENIYKFEKEFSVVLPEDYKAIHLKYNFSNFLMGYGSGLRCIDELFKQTSGYWFDTTEEEIAQQKKTIWVGFGEPYEYILKLNDGSIHFLDYENLKSELIADGKETFIAKNFELFFRGCLYAELKRQELVICPENRGEEVNTQLINTLADQLSDFVGGHKCFRKHWKNNMS